ncbi:ABC transporter substrate-binding protein [Nocardiopsis baichengensis]|uniref:ABC transporter substrate-binding protein n=1 Tax=Nocardiopsis baichengensis TaxID=280240 RepID=UPI00047701EF|nr:ABC transporter substrate-binding protein [Nocardiopsis baichengensis]
MRLPPVPRAAPVTVAAVLALAGCSSGAGPDPAGETRTVEGAGGAVEVPADPERVAVLWRPTLSAATRVGADVVGTLGDPTAADGALAPFLPDGAEAPPVVSGSPAEGDVDLERLAEAEPDLIIGVSTAHGAQAEALPELEAIAPTVLLEWTGTESWRGHLSEVAEVLGVPEEAEAAEEEYRRAVGDARTRIEDAVGDPASVEVSLLRLQSPQEIRIETPASFPGQIADDLGLARPEGHREPDAERDFVSESYENLDRADADVLFVLSGSGYEDAPDSFGSGVWAELGAVRDERVYAADYDHWGASNHYAALRVARDLADGVTGEAEPAL